MKKYFNILFTLFTVLTYSQKMQILDSIDNKTIPYAEIILDGNSYFADSLGIIEITKKIENPIHIKKIGYNDKKVLEFKNKIYLSPFFKEIKEVVLKQKKEVVFESKLLSKNTTKLPNDLTIGYFINGKENSIGKLKEISIPIKRIYDNKTLLKIDFYNKTDSKINEKPLNEESIIINVKELSKSKNNKINLQDYNIFFSESVLISIRIIDENGKTEKYLKDPSIQFYNSKEKGDIYFYNQYLNSWKILSSNINLLSISYVVSY